MAGMSPSPMWGAPVEEHGLGEPGEKGQGPQRWWGQGQPGRTEL